MTRVCPHCDEDMDPIFVETGRHIEEAHGAQVDLGPEGYYKYKCPFCKEEYSDE